MTADIKLLPFTEYLRSLPAHCRGRIDAYARANVSHATAPLQAEIEALRVDVEAWKASHSMLTDTCHHFQAQAKRLAEALRDLLALPEAASQLHYLDKGIGTATEQAAWLRASALLRDQEEGK